MRTKYVIESSGSGQAFAVLNCETGHIFGVYPSLQLAREMIADGNLDVLEVSDEDINWYTDHGPWYFVEEIEV